MEGEPELAIPPAGTKFLKPNQSRPISINPDAINRIRSFNTASSFSSITSSSTSPPEFVRRVQAAFKLQGPIGTMQLNTIKPKRYLVSQRETSKETNTDNQKHACITPPSELGVSVSAQEENFKPHTPQELQLRLPAMSGKIEPKPTRYKLEALMSSSSISSSSAATYEFEWMSKKQEDYIDCESRRRKEANDKSFRILWKEAWSRHVPACGSSTRDVVDSQRFTGNSQRGKDSMDNQATPRGVDDRMDSRSGVQSAVVGSSSVTSSLINSTPASRDVEAGGISKTTRKGDYDPELFFKVNGKLYQRLEKIGSGGSSVVHKVMASDCKIYALKKIKLKDCVYATAFGFCQEIGYLKRLKGKKNIIRLIDYEVTDKTLLVEAMNGSMSAKDSRVEENEYIYMVLEYGETDLARMLYRKWKEASLIDYNWLRFYWQQILVSVNTIHEERIVHMDLKPANFLLVRGSLKLIDFGIAKAMMSDTTNIQRRSQVGTTSYMSPEAFMCNETDANGNMIKCGRPSDIWSLGCILYEMVYGRTPFSEYKTFWAKFKVITDPSHEIVYKPVSNPWLLDLMRKCLAWDRNDRWRIPELLNHPFLVPPIPPLPQAQSCTFLQQIKETSLSDEKALDLYSQLQSLLIEEPGSVAQPDMATSKEQLRERLRKISTICYQLQQHMANS